MKYFLWTYLIVLFLFPVHKGFGQQVLDRYAFVGNDHYSDGQLAEWGGVLEENMINSLLVETINKKIIDAYQAEGYLYARIDSVVFAPIGEEKRVALTWYINEGQIVRLGKVTVQIDSLDMEELDNRLDFYYGDIYRKEQVEAELEIIAKYFADNGYPLAIINIENTNLKSEDSERFLDLSILVDPGPQIFINQIRIKGNEITKPEVILREIGVQSGDCYNQERIDAIPGRLNRLGYFNNVDPVKIVNLKGSRTDLLIEVREGNTTTFDGVVGYIPAESNQNLDEGYFTGLLNLNFKNLFGTGRKFEVRWRKPNPFSEQFRIFYEEPWVLNMPLNLGVGLERLVRDTTYIEQQYFLNSVIKLSSEFRAYLRFSREEVFPDSTASRNLRMTRNTISNGEIGVEYDTRDYPVNPRSGVNYSALFKYGLKKNTGPAYVIEEDSLALLENLKTLQVNLSYYQPLWSNQVLAVIFHGGHIQGDKNQLQLSDHFWFGGFGSVRGYREDQFHGTSVSWINLEYRFIVGRNSRIFIFNDWGYYQYRDGIINVNDIVPGYGIGIRFDSPLGIMGVDYGIGRGDTFSTGKIHFGIINNF